MATRKTHVIRQSSFERIQSGIPGLDSMLEGGIPKNSITLLCGASGSGKTLLALQYLYNGVMEHDEPGVYISFSESPEAIYQHGRVFGWDLEALAAKNKFAVIRYEPHEVVRIIEEGGGLIRDTVESIGAKRLVIDSLTAYELLFDNEYKRNESILYLFELLRKWGTTALLTSESWVVPNATTSGAVGDRIGFLTDGIIHLYYIRKRGRQTRALEVIKMRDTTHEVQLRKFELVESGLKICKGGAIGRL